MAKRFTDTDKWKKDFIKGLSAEMKLIWFYITDECDISGVWQVEWDILKIRTGVDISQDFAMSVLGEKILAFDGGKKWFIPEFIDFQYGELKPSNRLHKAILDKLEMYKNKGLTSPLQGAKDKDKDKDKEIIEGGVGETNLDPVIIFPIEHCSEIAMNDPRWVKANKATREEVATFNGYLEKLSEYQKNPLDYKRHFAHFKHKYPDRLAPTAKELSIEEWRQLANEFDNNLKSA